MANKLYIACPVCQQSGNLSVTERAYTVPVLRSCPACKPLRVVETGLTEGQVEMHLGWLKEYESALRELREAMGGLDRQRWMAAKARADDLLAKRRLS